MGSYLSRSVPCGVLTVPASPVLAAQLLSMFFSLPPHCFMGCGELKGSGKHAGPSVASSRPFAALGSLCFCQASAWHTTKPAVVCRCGEEESEEEPLPWAACGASAEGWRCRGPAAGTARRMKTWSSLSRVRNVAKGLLKVPSACDGFADTSCNPTKAKPPHTRSFCTLPSVLSSSCSPNADVHTFPLHSGR